MIPDTQVKPGVPTDNLNWFGEYIVDEFKGEDIAIIHIGDHADMPSLSAYDKGKKEMEGKRYVADIQAANDGFDLLNDPLRKYNKQKKKNKEKQWWPERHITLGNHENRITRAAENDAQLDGLLTLDALNYADHGWQVHDYLEPVDIDGVLYSHFFYQPMSGRPYSGENLLLRLKNIGKSFAMGHQQTFSHAVRYVNGQQQNGLVAGASYLHEESYRGPQANAHWRGIIVCHEVEDGAYDIMPVSLKYLCRRYEGKTLDQFMGPSWSFGWTKRSPQVALGGADYIG